MVSKQSNDTKLLLPCFLPFTDLPPVVATLKQIVEKLSVPSLTPPSVVSCTVPSLPPPSVVSAPSPQPSTNPDDMVIT